MSNFKITEVTIKIKPRWVLRLGDNFLYVGQHLVSGYCQSDTDYVAIGYLYDDGKEIGHYELEVDAQKACIQRANDFIKGLTINN